MSFDDAEKKDFIANIAAIFEENLLPFVESEKEIEEAILFAIDYCLDKKREQN
ncbi:MAG: hypothetical protein S4CHLAM20_13030 [Chlamydiia bacterium]|nr:hypothetical protein [Chlamydiia bacterium]